MIIIIDGYNVLKQIMGNKLISSRERMQYIRTVQRYVDAKHHSAIIVFDGGENAHPTHEQYGMVAVVYAGTTMTADAWIIDHLRTLASSSVILVSSDRNLIQHAEKYHIVSIGSYDFYAIVQEACRVELQPLQPTISKNQKIIKLHPDEISVAEKLMHSIAQSLSIMPHKNVTMPLQKTSVHTKRIKKRDKALIKKLRAL